MAVLAIKVLLCIWAALLISIGAQLLEGWAKGVLRSVPKRWDRKDGRKAAVSMFIRDLAKIRRPSTMA